MRYQAGLYGISVVQHNIISLCLHLKAHGGEEATRKIHDLTNIANLKPYTSFWVKDIEAGGGTDYVLLCKDNKSPFIKINKGEYLQALESAIPRYYETEKKKIVAGKKETRKEHRLFYEVLRRENRTPATGLKKTKERYRDRLGEVALTSAQPSLSDLENSDIFSNGTLTDPESTSGRALFIKLIR